MTFEVTSLGFVRTREASLQRKQGRKSCVILPLGWLVMHGVQGVECSNHSVPTKNP